MRKVLSVTLFVFLIAACTGSVDKREEKAEEERTQLIMQYLQGIWVDDNKTPYKQKVLSRQLTGLSR